MRARLTDPLEDDPGWDELARTAAEPDPLAEPPGLRAAVRHLPDGVGVRLLRVDDDAGVPLLALPVVRTQYRQSPVPLLAAWQHRYAVSAAVLLAPGAGPDAVAAGLAAVRAAGGPPWLLLRRVRLDGPVGTAVRGAAAGVRVEDEVQRPVVHRRPEPTYLEGRLSARSRKNLRRLERRLSEAAGGTLELADAASDPSAVERFLALERHGWKGRAGTALLCRPGDAAFFRETCRALAAQGRLEVWQLRGEDGRVAASQVNVRSGRTVLHWKTAYDEQLAAWSPGVQMELGLLSRFHDDPSLELLDSGVEPGGTVSDRLYPDAVRLGDVLLPLSGAGRGLVSTVPTAYAALRRGRRALALRRGGARGPAPAPATPGWSAG